MRWGMPAAAESLPSSLDLHAANPYLAFVANRDPANSGALASLPSEPPRETTGWLFS